MGLLSLLTLGFFLGMRHATDSDHVAAVSTIVSREPSVKAASMIGAIWGIGHTLTIMIVGGAIILFGVVFSARAGLALEFSVALMLIVLGTFNIFGFRRDLKILAMYQHTHAHDGLPMHSHAPKVHASTGRITPALPRGTGIAAVRVGARRSGLGPHGVVRSFIVGTVHGLAGSAAVALLVLDTIRDSWWALLYLLAFGLGTVAGMMLVTTALAVPLVYTSQRSRRAPTLLRSATGVISVVLGVFLAYRTGFVDGLFGAAHWDPH